MRNATFETIQKLIKQDPLTQLQKNALSGDGTYTLITQKNAAEILGVSTHTICHLDIPKVIVNKRKVQYKILDIYKYIDSHTEV